MKTSERIFYKLQAFVNSKFFKYSMFFLLGFLTGIFVVC